MEDDWSASLKQSGAPLAVADRLPGVMRSYPMRDGVWLVGQGRSAVDGAGNTKVVVKSYRGETLASFDFPHHVVRVFASFERASIIVLTARLDVFVLDVTGRHITELSLARNPEVMSVLSSPHGEPKPRAAIRGVDISPTTGDTAFSVIDRVWRFAADGRPLFGTQIVMGEPPEPESELNLPPGNSIDLFRQIEADTRGDWIYFIRLSTRDDSLFVSTYSGQLLRFWRTGELMNHWRVDGPVEDILETDDGIIASTEWSGGWMLPYHGDREWFPYGGRFHFAHPDRRRGSLQSGDSSWGGSPWRSKRSGTLSDGRSTPY